MNRMVRRLAVEGGRKRNIHIAMWIWSIKDTAFFGLSGAERLPSSQEAIGAL